jgi:hypothetical protein
LKTVGASRFVKMVIMGILQLELASNVTLHAENVQSQQLIALAVQMVSF